MRRYVLLSALFLSGLLPWAAGQVNAATTEVWIFPAVKYVAQSSPTFSVDVRAENVMTYPQHVRYEETNVDSDLPLGLAPEVRASYAETNVDTDLTVGADAAGERRAQGFRVTEASPVNRVLVWAKKVGDPEDALRVEIRPDSGGLPDPDDGLMLSESTAVGAPDSIGTSYGWVAFDLLTPPVLSPGTQYHLVVRRTLPVDASNYFVWGADTSSPAYANGAASVAFEDGEVWVWSTQAPAADHAFVADTAVLGRAQGFQMPDDSPVNRVLLWLKRVGPLAEDDGELIVRIYDDNGGAPGTKLGESAGRPVYECGGDPPQCIDLLGTSYDWVEFEVHLDQLLAGPQYHLALLWRDPESGTYVMPESGSYVAWGGDTSSPGYAEGVAIEYYGGLTWVEATPPADHAFEVAYACALDPEDPSGPTGPCGLGGFEIEIGFETAEFTYDDITEGDFLTSTGRSLIPCSHPGGHDPANGKVVYRCTTSGATPLGPEGSGVLATATFTALGSGGLLNMGSNTILFDINSIPLAHDTQGNQVIVEDLATDDEEGDGCTDIEEAGSDPLLGGHRNPHSPWDFYDVPVPANPDPTANGARSGAVTMGDVLAVLAYVGTFEGGPPSVAGVDYDSLKDGDWFDGAQQVMYPDGATDAWDKVGRQYDRSPTWPFSGWSGAPNGAVTMGDVLAALLQVGHSCTNPP